MGAPGILKTRLLPPRLPPNCVSRPELLARLEEGLQGPVLAVVAGAGYGKTTLLAQALESSEMPWVWCSCDTRITGARSLLAHIAAGLAERFPGFGAGLATEGTLGDQVMDLCNEIAETVPEDFAICLDDVHLLPEPAMEVVVPLLEAMPPNSHVVLAGRTPLPLGITRLAPGRVVLIDETSLAFTLPEAELLVRSVRLELPRRQVEDLHRTTEGWPAGLLLVAQSGSPGGPRAGRDGAEFAYLAEEVFAALSEDTRRFMEDTSILSRFSPELAEAVSGNRDARAVLHDLVSRHLFTVRLGHAGEWFRYHHLLQEFLRTRAGDRADEHTRALHLRAAEWWVGNGDPAEAVPHLLRAGDTKRFIQVLEPVAQSLALGPTSETLAAWLETVPEDEWRDSPGILLAHASLMLTQAQHEASFAEQERAIGRLISMQDDDRASAALLNLHLAMLLAGTPPMHRVEVGRRWQEVIAPEAAQVPVTRLLLASAYGYAGRFEEARKEFATARTLPAVRESSVLQDLASLLEGFYVDFWFTHPHEVVASFERSRKRLVEARERGAASYLPFLAQLECYLRNEVGDYDRALEIVEEFFDEARRMSVQRSALRSAQWVRFTALAGLGRWDELDQEYLPGPETDNAGVLSSYSYRHRALTSRLAASMGRREEAIRQIQRGRTEMARFGQTSDEGTFLCQFALAADAAGDRALAAECAEQAASSAEAIGSAFTRARAALVSALCTRDEREIDSRLDDALALTDEHELEFLWTHWARPMSVPLLVRAMASGTGGAALAERLLVVAGSDALSAALRLSEDAPEVRTRIAALAADVPEMGIEMIDRLLRDRDARVREAARRSWTRLKSRPRASITIRALGPFRVERDGIEVPASTFVRQKARALLAVLVIAHGPVHRETLCESLWPDLPPERAGASLRTTLYDLRRAIEPELEAGSPASVIVAEGDTVRLALTSDDHLDLIEFDRRVVVRDQEPASLLARLIEADALYRGPLLQEWPYEEWTLAPRARFEDLFDAVLEHASRAALAVSRLEDAVHWAKRLVRRQPEREGAHRLLMLAFASAGDRALALRQYHACRAVLRREQGIEPGAETRALYTRLLADEDLPAAAPTVL